MAEGPAAWVFSLQTSTTSKQSSPKLFEFLMHSSFCRNIFTSHLCESSDLGICHLPWEELNRNWLQPDHSEISGELKFYLLIFTKHLGLEIVFDMKIIFICVPSDMGYRSALPGKLQAPWVLKASGCGNASQVLSMCIPGTNPVKTESWSCQGWKEPLEIILFNTLCTQDHLLLWFWKTFPLVD